MLLALCLCLSQQAWAGSKQAVPEQVDSAVASPLVEATQARSDQAQTDQAEPEQRWRINLLEYKQRLRADALVTRLGYKDFIAAVAVLDSDHYQVFIPALSSHEDAVAYRQRLLRKTNILPDHIHIVVLPVLPQPTRSKPVAQSQPESPVPVTTAIDAQKSATAASRTGSLDTAIFHVSVNGKDEGDHFFRQDNSGGIWSTSATLKELGISGLPGLQTKAADKPVALSRFPKDLSYTFDAEKGELQLTVRPERLLEQHLALTEQPQQQGEMLSGNSAFLNYNVNYGWTDRGGNTSLSLPLEAGIRVSDFFLSGNVQYSRANKRWLRTQSQLIWDDQDSMIRVSAGDITASTGAAGIGALLGGITVARNFALQPYRVTTPETSFNLMIPTTSDVKFYVNGSLIKEQSVDPGPLTITDLPFYSGQSDLEVVIRDAFGRETRHLIPYFYSPALLNSDLDEFSISFGIPRQTSASGQLIYQGAPALLGFRRSGITDWLTAGMHAAYRADRLNAGLSADMITGSVGALNLLISASRQSAAQGLSGSLNYSMVGWKGLSPNLFFRASTPAYQSIFEQGKNQRNRWEGGGGFGFSLFNLGNISARYSRQWHQDGSTGQKLSGFYSTRLLKAVGLTFSGTWNWDSKLTAIQKDYTLGLNYVFKNGLSLNLSGNSNNGMLSGTLQLQMNTPLTEGFGYSASVQKSERSNNYNNNDRINYRGRYGAVAISRSGGTKNGSYSANLNGSVAYVDSAVYISRPISDGFAVVKAKGMKDIPVTYNNQYIGATNGDGALLVPNLIAYNDNTLGIDVGEMPMGYQVKAVSKTVSVPFRSGGVVDFGVTKIQAVEGVLFIEDGKGKKTAQYYGLDLVQGDHKQTAIVGYGGAFYIENMSSGLYKARLYNETRACSFDMTIPESDDMFIKLGDVICKIPQEE